MSEEYSDAEVVLWHKDYSNKANTARFVSQKYGVKHETMLRRFRKLNLWLRPSGFRAANYKGGNPPDSLKYRYLWFLKFAYKRRAIIRGIDFTLSDDQFIELVTSPCYYCGTSHLSETRVVHKVKVNMLTVDRIDSSKGYTLDNCVAACKQCNFMKLDYSVDEWFAKMKQILEKHKKL